MQRPILPVLALASLALACSPPADPADPTAFHLHFHPVDTIHLQEPPGDTIAEIGIFQPLPDGGFLISDRFLPRIRRYDTSGALVAAQGRFGDGPFEYRHVFGLGQDPSGRVVIMAPDQPRLTVLSADLAPDTLIPLGDLVAMGTVQPFDGGVLLRSMRNDPGAAFRGEQVGDSLHYLGQDGRIHWAMDARGQPIHTEPYWFGSSPFLTAVAGDTLLALAHGLVYPIHLVGRAGREVGVLHTPPPSYRRAPSLEPGALAGPVGGRGTTTLNAWLDSFTLISELSVVGDSMLVVAHGRYDTSAPTRGPAVAYAIDLYHLPTLTKVAEDIPLPPDATILGGGAYLHLLVAKPPEPWTIVRWRYGGGQ